MNILVNILKILPDEKVVVTSAGMSANWYMNCSLDEPSIV
jgi:hypothetical protein